MDNHKWAVENISGHRGIEGVWNADSRYIHRLQLGDGVTVGGYISGIISMYSV